jgi:thiosulfate/3-mercaptopyruvate sulfurtransferase
MTASSLSLGLLVETEELAQYIHHPLLRVVDLTRRSVYEQLHLPHAIHLQPKYLMQQNEQATGLLPNDAGLTALIEYLNISPEHHVVVYDDEGGAWAGRLIWNLHCLGFEQVSLLNGGLHGWLGAGLTTTSEIDPVIQVERLVQVNTAEMTNFRIQYDDLLQKVEQGSVQIWDCRTEEEYTGQRLAARRGGHPLERTQQRLEQLGFQLDQPVIVYCQSHHRSGLAYILGRLLNWKIQAYDGAWSEWGNRLDSPIVSGESPS